MLLNGPVTAGADCKTNPATFLGHVKMTFVPEGLIVSDVPPTLTDSSDRLNTVPLPELPPYAVVPYRVLPDKIKPADGLAPSLLV